MYRYARATLKDVNPDFGKLYQSNRTASKPVVQLDPDLKYYVVTGIHGDVPNNNGDFFRYAEELLKLRPNLQHSCGCTASSAPVYTYQTWNGKGNFINHNSMPGTWDNPNRVGTIIDTYPIPEEKCVDFLLGVDKVKYPWLIRAVDDGDVTDVSMGCWVEWSLCSRCGHLATSEENYCNCLKYHKGMKIDGQMVYEDNRDVTGMEMSWIINGNGADPFAKKKHTIAGDYMSRFQSVSRSSSGGASDGGGGGYTGVDNSDMATAMRLAKAGMNGRSIFDTDTQTHSIILPDDVQRKLAIAEKVLANTTDDQLKQLMGEDILEEVESVESQIRSGSESSPNAIRDQIADAHRMRMQFAATHGEGSRVVKSLDEQISALQAEMNNNGTSEMEVSTDMSEEVRIAKKVDAELAKRLASLKGSAGGSASVRETEDEKVNRIVSERLAAMGITAESETPSATLHNTNPPAAKKSEDPSSMINGEKPGKSHSVEIKDGETSTDADPSKTAVPSATMENPQGKYDASTDPESMIKGEKPGKDHSIDMPVVQAMMSAAVTAAVNAVLAQTKSAIPSPAQTDGGKLPSFPVDGKDPDKLIAPDKAGAAHSITMPEAGDTKKESGTAIPSPAQQSGKLPSFPASGKDPESFIKPEKKGNAHDVSIPTATASFKVNKDNYLNSAWMIMSGNKPIMSVTASQAFPVNTKENYEWFSSDKYANALVDAVRSRGHKSVAFEVGAQLFDKDMPEKADNKLGGSGDSDDKSDHKSLNPSPDAAAKISDDTGDKIPIDELLKGVFSVLVVESGYTIDEVKSELQHIAGDGLDDFMSGLQGSIDELKGGDSKGKKGGPEDGTPEHEGKETPEEEEKEHADGKEPVEKSEKKLPPFLKKADQAKVTAPAEEDAHAFYAELFPPEFVRGLFAGDKKTVETALKAMADTKKENVQLSTRVSKTIQAKRVQRVIEAMEAKGMFDDGKALIASGVPESVAKTRAAEYKSDLAQQLLDMDDKSFGVVQAMMSAAAVRTASVEPTILPKTGMRAMAQIKNTEPVVGIPGSTDEYTDMWSTPMSIDESVVRSAPTKKTSRIAQSFSADDVESALGEVESYGENDVVDLCLSAPSNDLMIAAGIDETE